ncbi:uncharacterized protein BKA55DRAFT_695330 [Fusarium redolens]|uniref:Uncharacterized protein n=1 Tax=Fusarium redolens TaxID=48865 RepID=A0A9P9G866_FUSRE|nr:uncharacterized protein BKA55DRAFT_695330 [Fusarium redolens]KAH7233810.1 hypothetical protein BKA55DRAFT_695330 [Fusarium redolens]
MKGLTLIFFALSVNATCHRQNACRLDGGVVPPGQNCRPNTDYCNLGACDAGQACEITQECDGWIQANWYNNCYVKCCTR